VITVDALRETMNRLNRSALLLPGPGATFRVHYWGGNPRHLDNPVHKHSCFEACYVLGGTGEYEEFEENGSVHPLRAHTLFLSRPGVVHQIRSRTGMQILYVAFEIDEPNSSAVETERFRRLSREARPCVAGARDAPTAVLWRSLIAPDKPDWRLSDEAGVSAAPALVRSFADFFSAPGPAEPARSGRSSDVLLSRAKMYIRDNLDRPITLAEVAAYLHVSERHLSRLFTANSRESFNTYLRRMRIQQAAYFLRHTDMAIKDIAERTGFGSVHSFTRAFARETGQPPGRYRSRREFSKER